MFCTSLLMYQLWNKKHHNCHKFFLELTTKAKNCKPTLIKSPNSDLKRLNKWQKYKVSGSCNSQFSILIEKNMKMNKMAKFIELVHFLCDICDVQKFEVWNLEKKIIPNPSSSWLWKNSTKCNCTADVQL